MRRVPVIYFFENGKIPEDYEWRFSEAKTTCNHAQGPNGKSGLLITPFETTEALHCDSGTHAWSRIKGIDIGVRKDARPDDFARDFQLGGHPVILGDKHAWTIPVALLKHSSNFSLPKYETMDESGRWVWEVDEQYEYISVLAKKVFEASNQEGDITLDEEEVRAACVGALAVNYNITEVEACALKLLTQASYQGILRALIDAPGLKSLENIIENPSDADERALRHRLWKTGLLAEYDPTYADLKINA